jgi:hypothetical protein
VAVIPKYGLKTTAMTMMMVTAMTITMTATIKE